jgi:hypothetical protein
LAGGGRKKPASLRKGDLASLPEYKNLLLAAQKHFLEPPLKIRYQNGGFPPDGF